MDAATNRQKVVEAIDELPADALLELWNFIEYLRYKNPAPPMKQEKDISGKAFLEAIAALGTSNEEDISERDEEILTAEVDPIYGWKKS